MPLLIKELRIHIVNIDQVSIAANDSAGLSLEHEASKVGNGAESYSSVVATASSDALPECGAQGMFWKIPTVVQNAFATKSWCIVVRPATKTGELWRR